MQCILKLMLKHKCSRCWTMRYQAKWKLGVIGPYFYCLMKLQIWALYHEPEWRVQLPQHLRSFRGDSRHPAAPQQRVEPRLIHRIQDQTDVVFIIEPMQTNTCTKTDEHTWLGNKGTTCITHFSLFSFFACVPKLSSIHENRWCESRAGKYRTSCQDAWL